MTTLLKIVTPLIFLFTLPCLAQADDNADAAAGEYINKTQWFNLYDVYESDSAKMSPMIRSFSKAMLATTFGTPTEAAAAIGTLVRSHQQEIGMENVVSMLSLMCKSLSQAGDNAKATATMKSLADQLEGKADTAMTDMLRQQEHYYATLAHHQLYKREHSDATSHTLPFSTTYFGTDSTQLLMHIHSRLNGRKCEMTFDTGAAYNVISPKLAAKHHLTITDATISVRGTKVGMGHIAIAKELTLGTLTLRNVPFVILDLDSGNERIAHSSDSYSCILGESLLMRFARYTLNFENSTITLFDTTTDAMPSHPDICFSPSGHVPYAQIECNGKRFAIALDTGAATTTLGNAFYRDNTALIAREGKWSIMGSTGFGGVAYDSVFRIPSLPMRHSSTTFTMHDIPVSALSTDNALNADYGRLGLDFFRMWKRVTIDNRAMKMTLEQ